MTSTVNVPFSNLLAFPLACATGVAADLVMALRFLRARDRVLDHLSNNAYGVYLIHYVFVLWLQYALVGAAMHAFGKMIIVFSTALALSWATSAGFRSLIGVGVRAAAPHAPAIPSSRTMVDQI